MSNDVATVLNKKYEHVTVIERIVFFIDNRWNTKDGKKKLHKTKYLCQCNYCGDKFERLSVSMQNPKCKCMRKNPNNETFENRKFCEYQGTSRRLGRAFELSREEFVNIIRSACSYCGVTPSNGVDREDTSKGYLKNNAVPCCTMCNKAKWDFDVESFKTHVKKMYDFLWKGAA